MANVYLSLGTNLGDKRRNLYRAVAEIESKIGKCISLSSFYETEPWGFTSGNSFLNAACHIETELSPLEVLSETQAIERKLGRTTKSANGVYNDRIIDIDLLLYDDRILTSPTLILPHPLMTERRFVMEPLAEIAPERIHPLFHKTFRELLSALL